MSSESFADLGVSHPILGALAERGITEPFAVQRLCIADVLAGEDVLVQSPTGSGKTLAFGVPMVDLIQAEARRPAALVLAPTRELAEQIVDELRSIAHSRALKIAPVFGGVAIHAQAKRAAQAHIVVATPGRLEDLLERGAFNLKQIRLLVLDEADRMLDIGFKPAIDRIVAKMPRDRQTLFFSATLEGAAGKLATSYTRNPRRRVHAPKADREAEVEHRFIHLAHEAKVDQLVRELRHTERGRTLVFVRTKRGADRLVKRLSRQKIRAVAMHGNKNQNQRRRALADFERGACDTLVATDVASRGIDVEDITHVINFDAPEDRDVYVHRTGRTGRAGASGVAASFVLPDQHRDMRQIARDLGLHREFDSGPGFEHAARQHSGNGGSGGNSFNRNGGSNGKRHSSNGAPRTYSARPPRNRRRRRR
ncbi:MAG TPA: DEAD/DEAH box helicase [Solirubrobacterales bacterium]|nr:DEAD/DEAH box helicase [Solirubrobacterales bacterium]